MLFERFIKHQKTVLAFFAAFLMVSFLIGTPLMYFLDDRETTDLPKLYGKEIDRQEWSDARTRLWLVGHNVVNQAYGGRDSAWNLDDDDFVHRWLILDEMARRNGLVVTDEEVTEVKDGLTAAYYDAVRRDPRHEVEAADSKADKARIGMKTLRKFAKENEWESNGWTWDHFETTMVEWTRIRKFLSYLLEHEVKVSIDDVFAEYQTRFTVRRLRYLQIDAEQALARLEGRTTPEELRKKAIESYLEKHATDPLLTTTTEADFVWLAPDVEDARREVDAASIPDEELRAHRGRHVDRFPAEATFDDLKETIRLDLADERIYEAMRVRVAAARKAYADSKGKKGLAEIALEQGLGYRRELGLESADVTGPAGAALFPDVDVQRLSRTVFQQLEAGDYTIVNGQTRPVLQRPVLAVLLARRREESKPELVWDDAGGLRTDRKKGVSPDLVLEAYFAANATKPAFARPATVTLEVILARREQLARTLRVTTEELREFHADHSKDLYRDGDKRDFEEDRLALEPIVLARKVQERLTERLDTLRREFTEEDKKKRSFDLVAGREGYESMKLGPIGREALAAHPVLGKAEGFADAVFALEKEAVSGQVFESGDARFFVRVVEKDTPEPPTWGTVDRDRVSKELVREYALDQAVTLLDEVKKDLEAKSPTAESLLTLFQEVARARGYVVHETKPYREASELEELKGATSLTGLAAKEPGAIEGPALESALHAACLYQVVEKDAPEKADMKPAEVEEIRHKLRQKAIETFSRQWTSPREVVLWAEDQGIFQRSESEKDRPRRR